MNYVLLYNNKLNGEIYTFITDFIKLNTENLYFLISEKRGYININTLNKKYEYENELMEYIGYLSINNINNIEDVEEILLNKNKKQFMLEDMYIHINYNDLNLICKKDSLFYKFKILKYSYLNNKLSKDLLDNIYLKTINKYKKNITLNTLNIILLNNKI